jgi:hypothetical protein
MPTLIRRANDLDTENTFVVLAEISACNTRAKSPFRFVLDWPAGFDAPLNIQDAAIEAIRADRLTTRHH